MLRAGIWGIKNKITPSEPVGQNIYRMTECELAQSGIKKLPSDLNDAVDKLLGDELIKTTLGEHILKNYVKAKRIEWAQYSNRVHEWEVENYLRRY
jgi:glutamine synthetase